MDWLKHWMGMLLSHLRRRGRAHEAPPLNRHELRDIGLEDRHDRPPLRDERGERIRARDPLSW